MTNKEGWFSDLPEGIAKLRLPPDWQRLGWSDLAHVVDKDIARAKASGVFKLIWVHTCPQKVTAFMREKVFSRHFDCAFCVVGQQLKDLVDLTLESTVGDLDMQWLPDLPPMISAAADCEDDDVGSCLYMGLRHPPSGTVNFERVNARVFSRTVGGLFYLLQRGHIVLRSTPRVQHGDFPRIAPLLWRLATLHWGLTRMIVAATRNGRKYSHPILRDRITALLERLLVRLKGKTTAGRFGQKGCHSTMVRCLLFLFHRGYVTLRSSVVNMRAIEQTHRLFCCIIKLPHDIQTAICTKFQA